MWRFIALLILITGAAFAEDNFHCDHVSYGYSYDKSKESILSDEIVSGEYPLYKEGVIKCNHNGSTRTAKGNEIIRSESGIFNGALYRIYYSDGSGTVQGLPDNELTIHDSLSSNWSISCEVDPIEDTHICLLSKKSIMILLKNSSEHYVLVGKKHYPGSDTIIRIDKGEPIKATQDGVFSLEDSKKIVKALQEGKTVVTRYMEWPYKRNKDEQWEIFGFNQAWGIINNIYSSIDVK